MEGRSATWPAAPPLYRRWTIHGGSEPMAMSVDGLVTGLSTTDMITQLMKAEAMPQTALKNKVTAQNKAVTAYQAVNTKLAALTTAATALGADAAWNPVKATSSSDA